MMARPTSMRNAGAQSRSVVRGSKGQTPRCCERINSEQGLLHGPVQSTGVRIDYITNEGDVPQTDGTPVLGLLVYFIR
jgi:hypothetical protein